jgi:hypothetical protein
MGAIAASKAEDIGFLHPGTPQISIDGGDVDDINGPEVLLLEIQKNRRSASPCHLAAHWML